MNPRVIKVDASAGAGKTRRLSERYIDLLFSGAEPSSILAITFTNDATEEMKSRILYLLKTKAIEENDRRAAELVDRLISDFSRFYVKTIDSFIRSIILASSYKSMEATPTLEVIHAVPGMLFRKIEEVIEDNPEEVEKLIESLYYDGLLTSWNIEGKIQEELRNIHEIYSSRNVRLELENNKGIQRLYEGFKEELRRFIDNCRCLHSSSRDSWKRRLEKDKIEELLEGIKRGKWFDKCPPECQKAFDRIQEKKSHLLREYLKKHFLNYLRVFHLVKEKMEEEAEKKGIVYLEELNRMADKYLNPEEFSELIFYLSEKINHFLIDEFQDTNRLQWKNLRLFVEEAISRGGSLFIVGDSKQAIYSFRGGDYRFFTEFSPHDVGGGLETMWEEDLKLVWKEETLVESRRSGRAIVDFVSMLFTEKLRELISTFLSNEEDFDFVDFDLVKQVYSNVKQKPARTEPGYVEVRNYTGKDREEKLISIGEEISYIVKDLISRGYGYGDIAILFRKNDEVRDIAGFLSLEKDYPVISESSLDIRTNPLVESTYNLLRVLHFPSEDHSFYSFILGDFFSQEEKLKFIRFMEERDREKPLYLSFRESFSEMWKDKFQDLFSLAGFLSPYELASMAISRFNVLNRFPESSVFILHFLEILKDYTDFSDFEEDWESGAEEKFSTIITGKTNAINLLTIHKSKGREFPVVVVPIIKRGIYRSLIKKIIELDGLLKFKKKVFLREMPSEDYKRILTDEVLSELNVVYVSITRARDELYILTEEGWVIPPSNYGEKIKVHYKKEVPKSYIEIETGNWMIRLSEKGRHLESIEERMGNFMHKVLEFLPQKPTIKDLDAAIKKAEAELGYYNEVEIVKKIFELPSLKYVLNQEGIVLCEREIAYNGEIIKPDRVVITPEEVLLLEYKTGKRESVHLEQVKKYKEALLEIYSKPVRTWLVYLTEGAEVQV